VRVVIFDKNQVKSTDGNSLVVQGPGGQAVLIVIQTGDLLEILTAGDGDRFQEALAVLNQISQVKLQGSDQIRHIR
jgi:hypothetical protein